MSGARRDAWGLIHAALCGDQVRQNELVELMTDDEARNVAYLLATLVVWALAQPACTDRAGLADSVAHELIGLAEATQSTNNKGSDQK